jgi:hypothetical protein
VFRCWRNTAVPYHRAMQSSDSKYCIVINLRLDRRGVPVRIATESLRNPSTGLSAATGLADDNAAMKRRRSWLRRLLPLALVLVPPTLAWSDAGFPNPSATKKTCYCDCDMKAGAPMCGQMCDLPKYANRSWAVSCLRNLSKGLSDLAPATHGQSGTHSRKTNRVQSAQLQD